MNAKPPLDKILEELRRARESHEAISVESIIAQYPAFQGDDEACLDLIYGEFCIREDLGEHPSESEYYDRFPPFHERLKRVFDVHWALASNPAEITETAEGSGSISDTIKTDQRERWSRGDRVLVESYLQEHRGLDKDRATLLDLICSEFYLRLEFGEQPNLKEYSERFPHLSREISQRLTSPEPTRIQPSGDTDADSRHGHPTQSLACPYCAAGASLVKEGDDGGLRCVKCGRRVRVLEETVSLLARPGRRLGGFELLRAIGSGHFGEVWLARDSNLRRQVAIKLPRTPDGDTFTADMFLREARAAAKLHHPNILPVYEAGKEQSQPYIVTAYIEGTDLKNLLTHKRFNAEEAARLCQTLALALVHAHAAGVIHRDLKPSNVLLDLRGRAYLADFGLAKNAGVEDFTITSEGQVLGTPAYMPPEQARGQTNSALPASDVYSLGVMLYELLTGQRPFEGRLQTLIYRILTEEPKPPTKLDKTIPRDLETICLKAMAKLPADRYVTAQDLADDLGRFLVGDHIHAKPISLLKRSARWTRRNALKAGAAGTIAALGGIAGAALLASTRRLPGDGRQWVRFFLGQYDDAQKFQPKNGHLTLVPVDPSTGCLLPGLMIHAEAWPTVELELSAGDYLVVAVVPGVGFHEVWRHVPKDAKRLPGTFPHQRWKALGSRIELPRIGVFGDSVLSNMSRFEGANGFPRAWGSDMPGGASVESVSAFHLDRNEVTIGDYRKYRGTLPTQAVGQPDNHAVTFVNFDEATYYAERIGKRLPTELEFEFAATNRGSTRFPWGNEPPSCTKWEVGAVSDDTCDRLQIDPRVVGLCSNVMEWTSSMVGEHPAYRARARSTTPYVDEVRIVQGAWRNRIEGEHTLPDMQDSGLGRLVERKDTWQMRLGFRCARSDTPRQTVAQYTS